MNFVIEQQKLCLIINNLSVYLGQGSKKKKKVVLDMELLLLYDHIQVGRDHRKSLDRNPALNRVNCESRSHYSEFFIQLDLDFQGRR